MMEIKNEQMDENRKEKDQLKELQQELENKQYQKARKIVSKSFSENFQLFECSTHPNNNMTHISTFPLNQENFFKLFCIQCPKQREETEFDDPKQFFYKVDKLFGDQKKKSSVKISTEEIKKMASEIYDPISEFVEEMIKQLNNMLQLLIIKKDDLEKKMVVPDPEQAILPILLQLTICQDLKHQQECLDQIQMFILSNQEKEFSINYQGVEFQQTDTLKKSFQFQHQIEQNLQDLQVLSTKINKEDFLINEEKSLQKNENQDLPNQYADYIKQQKEVNEMVKLIEIQQKELLIQTAECDKFEILKNTFPNQKYFENFVANSAIIQGLQKQEQDFFKCIGIAIKTPIKSFKLLYKAKGQDLFKASEFHRLCDNQGPTLSIIQSENNFIFGGFTKIPWDSLNNWQNDTLGQSFLYSINNRKILGIQTLEYAIYSQIDYNLSYGGGHDIHIANDCDLNKSSYSNINSYVNGLTGKQVRRTLIAGSRNFKVLDIEVFQLTF